MTFQKSAPTYPAEEAVSDPNQVEVQGKTFTFPGDGDPSALALTESELTAAFYAFEASLAKLRLFFPQSKIRVVYIPAPLRAYRLRSDAIEVEPSHEGRSHQFNTTFLEERGSYIFRSIKAIVVSKGFDIVNLRPDLLKATSTSFVHGPEDWTHFNKNGYQLLIDNVLKLMN